MWFIKTLQTALQRYLPNLLIDFYKTVVPIMNLSQNKVFFVFHHCHFVKFKIHAVADTITMESNNSNQQTYYQIKTCGFIFSKVCELHGSVMPNTHRRRRRDSTVELSRVELCRRCVRARRLS